jgi:DUF1365 family protein
VVNAAPGLYVGTLRHRRFHPRAHAFEYSLFMVLLDIDRLREAMAVSVFTSYNRWNWATFAERDHLERPGAAPDLEPGGEPSSLRHRLSQSAAAAGHTLPDGQIYLLTHLRYAGYVFNPISLYYCHDRDGHLQLVMADVSNTYGGRHSYWLRPNDQTSHRFRAEAAKSLYVSPFMPSDVRYEFILTPPSDNLVVHMNVTRAGGNQTGEALFDATLTLARRPWTARTVRDALLRWPWMTAKVIAAIHFEAVRLCLKRVPTMPLKDLRQ